MNSDMANESGQEQAASPRERRRWSVPRVILSEVGLRTGIGGFPVNKPTPGTPDGHDADSTITGIS
jgi:hypothetical protein